MGAFPSHNGNARVELQALFSAIVGSNFPYDTDVKSSKLWQEKVLRLPASGTNGDVVGDRSYLWSSSNTINPESIAVYFDSRIGILRALEETIQYGYSLYQGLRKIQSS